MTITMNMLNLYFSHVVTLSIFGFSSFFQFLSFASFVYFVRHDLVCNVAMVSHRGVF